jgi:C1A family cysteine protease
MHLIHDKPRRLMSPHAKKRDSGTTHRHMRGYGWLPDLPDHRDILYGTERKIPAAIPESVDLRPGCSDVEDQGALGSCTANALAGALEFLELKNGVPFADLSRLFIYYNERVIEGTVKFDSGAMLRDGIKTLVRQGVCTEKRWPYDIAKFARKPPAACYKNGLEHQIMSYQRILSLDEMLACLAEGFPFVFGFAVYESFETPRVARTGVVEMPESHERVVGGHAVVAVGYVQFERRFIVRNSWGQRWGMRGYFTIPFEYLADRSLADDFWTVRGGENV